MGTFGSALDINKINVGSTFMSPTDAATTITVGYAPVAQVSYTDGAALNAATANDAWTDFVDINLGVPFMATIQNVKGNGLNYGAVAFSVALGETAGDYVRVQVERDGTAIYDVTVTKAAGDVIEGWWMHSTNIVPVGGSEEPASTALICNSRLKIRCLRHGTLDQANTEFVSGRIFYSKLVT